MEKKSDFCKFHDAGFQTHSAALKDASTWGPSATPTFSFSVDCST